MQIASTELKALLKRLGSSKAESLIMDFGGGRLVAQDPELTLIASSPKLQSGEGVLSTNLRKLTTVVNRMSGDIDISYDGQKLTLKGKKSKVELETKAVKIPAIKAPPTEEIPMGLVKDLLKFAASAADTNKASSWGYVVQLKTEDIGIEETKVVALKAAGTNGAKLAFQRAEYEGKPFSYLVTLPAVNAIQNLSGDTLQMAESSSHFYFSDGQTHIFASKLSKEFPSYETFIPKDHPFKAEVGAGALKESLRLLEPMVDTEQVNSISVHFLDGSLTLKTYGTVSVAEDTVEYTQTAPDPIFESYEFRARVDITLLLDFLNTVEGTVTIEAKDNQSPILLSSGNKKYMISVVVEKG